MAATCQWDCGCWDCSVDRRNSIRFALVTCALIALAGGVFVALQVQSSFDFHDQDQDDPPLAQVVETA
jgi:hypothetical protein